MSTQRAHEPFLSRVRALFFAHHQHPQHEPWERYLHQRNEPVYEPEPDHEPPIGARQRALLAAQLREVGMEPVYLPMPRHTTGPVTPIPATPRDTDRMRQLALPAPRAPRENREWADVTTAKELPMQHLLNVVLPGNALPVQRFSNEWTPLRHFEQSGDLPATTSPRGCYELPAVVDTSSLVSAYINALPPWQPLPPPVDPPNAWINSNVDSGQVWSEPETPQVPFPTRAELFADVRTPSQPLEDGEPTVLHERTKANRNFQEILSQLKESEK